MSQLWKRPLLWVVALFGSLFLLACYTASTTTASCAFVVGNGREGRDTELHRIVYPGQQVTLTTYETPSYVPCNSRNYIINDGTVKGATGKPVGDRGTLIVASTNTGTTINVAARALWTLNQSKQTMEDFYEVCHKYSCASPKDVTGDSNFATDGWNGMLAENFGPTMDKTAKIAAFTMGDELWQKQDPKDLKILGDGMSDAFADVIRANLGYSHDLFCGSGNSAWSDPNRPGENTFTCSAVRIVVDSVILGPARADQSVQSAVAINKQRFQNAEALYGPDAGYWLGIQDSIDKCKAASTPCIINVGSGGGVSIPVPGARVNQATTPTPTPTPRS